MNAHPNGYVCLYTETKPTFTGDLESPAWKTAEWTNDFVDIEGSTRPKPRYRTRVKMLWDSEYFYIAAELEEPHIWATQTEHDSVIFYDNDFEVFIDPDGDNHQYYELEINAFGTYWDLRLTKPYRDGGIAVNQWEIPGLKSNVQIFGTINNPHDTDKEWVIELAFPWRDLNEFAGVPTPPQPGDQWRVNFSRVQWKTIIKDGLYAKLPDIKEDNWVWSPQNAIDMHKPEMWGYVQFEINNKPFQIDPDWEIKCNLFENYYQNNFTSHTISIKGPSGKTWHISRDSKLWSTI